MPSHVIAVLFPIALLILSGCSAISQRFPIDDDLLLLSPEEAPATKLVKQKVAFSRDEKTQTFIVLSKISRQTINVLVLLPTGQTFLEMGYDGQHFTSSNKTHIELPEREIMAILQFSQWPINVLQRNYTEAAGWQFNFDKNYRQLKFEQQPYLLMNRLGDDIKIQHVKHDYQVLIQPLESDNFE